MQIKLLAICLSVLVLARPAPGPRHAAAVDRAEVMDRAAGSSKVPGPGFVLWCAFWNLMIRS